MRNLPASDIIWWHVYPLGATGAPIREEHDEAPRLRQLEPWLDYLIELGCNGLLLGPIFKSVSHGYDTLDHFQIAEGCVDVVDLNHFLATFVPHERQGGRPPGS